MHENVTRSLPPTVSAAMVLRVIQNSCCIELKHSGQRLIRIASYQSIELVNVGTGVSCR